MRCFCVVDLMWPLLPSLIWNKQYLHFTFFSCIFRFWLCEFFVVFLSKKSTQAKVWIPCYFLTYSFSGKLASGHHKRSGTWAALVLHTYLVCAHISITQLGPSDEATCNLRMSVAPNPSDLNNPKSNKGMTTISGCSKSIFPQRLTGTLHMGVRGGLTKNSGGKLNCLWYCVIATLDPPLPPFHCTGLNDTSLIWST